MATAEQLLDEELQIEHELALERARTTVLGFITFLDQDFVVNWHHRLLCKLLDDMVDGDLTRLLVSMPPRAGKSQIISRYFPAYMLGRDPDSAFICASYGAELANAFTRDVQRVIESEAYHEVFPATTIKAAGNPVAGSTQAVRKTNYFEVVGHSGRYRAAGVGGSLTGQGGNWLVMDDLTRNADQARSPTIMAAQREWYDAVFRTRAARGAKILGAQTRWSEGDTFGHIISTAKANPDADQFLVINLPAINEEGPSKYDPRQVGEALWPEFFPLQGLLAQKAINARSFSALYQGQPTPSEGGIIKQEWWRFYRTTPVQFERVIICADLTFGSQKGDFCAWQVWGKLNASAYLLGRVNARQDFNQQVACLMRLVETWPEYREVLIEDAANGAALVSYIRAKVPRVVPIRVKDSKEARAEAVSPLIEAGNVYLPDVSVASWVQEYMLQLRTFPNGRFDDEVDCTTMALARLFPPVKRSAWTLPVSIKKGDHMGGFG